MEQALAQLGLQVAQALAMQTQQVQVQAQLGQRTLLAEETQAQQVQAQAIQETPAVQVAVQV